MAITPIDLQANISQMSEVGRGEQVKTEAIAEQQHQRAEESNEKSKLVNTKLDEMKKAEKTRIDEELEKNKKDNEASKKKKEQENIEAKGKEGKREVSTDDKMGLIIDVFK
ncbi:hypothetical protein ACFL20_12170 [Spirochaetota bacterium]